MVMFQCKTSDAFTTLKYTKFATISSNGSYVVKSICRDIIVPPHDSRSELSILKKLNESPNIHIIKLLGSDSTDEYLNLYLPLYDMDLNEYMHSCYKPRKNKKFNPYLSLKGPREGHDHHQIYENMFNVNDYAYDFMLQLAGALKFIHSHGIIHRDLKPQNVLLNREQNPQLVLTDFGISYDTEDPVQLQKEDPNAKITDVSTSIYKAPELLFGVKNYSFAVDIWALLVIISQWFCSKAYLPLTALPGMFDDGSGQLNDGGSGSDIKLIFSIFSHLGIPPIEEWAELEKNGSSAAFQGMFGTCGDGNYILNKTKEEQLQKIYSLMPRLQEIKDDPTRKIFENCILGMLPFESSQRWNSNRIVCELKTLNL